MNSDKNSPNPNSPHTPSADRYRTDPADVRVIPHARIPLQDGTELAARIWMPVDAPTAPVPAVLEYIPYRKNDMTAARDLTIHPEFARAGYVSIRVDMRGCGDSTGRMTDEYSETELSDGLEVLRWIGEQEWCSGRVGIIGKSWGGFNGLQLAALRPPELAAIITVCSTDDRYADDVHYNGGAIVADQMLSWASTMWAYNARPQDPQVMGESWRDDWIGRIDEAPVNIEDWLSHQRRDDYWKHASVCEDPSAIEVPVLAVGGLLDEYRTAPYRLMEQASATVHALIGPWAHTYPHQGAPGPAIDFIAESVRWWDAWMLDVDNGVAEQPQLRAYIPDPCPIGADHAERPGRWIAEQSWPSPRVQSTVFDGADAAEAGFRRLSSTAPVGLAAGSWLQFGEPAAQPTDQRADDAHSLTFDWEVDDGIEIVGTPSVRLRASCDRDRGVIAARLCDVAPDGSSRLLTMGLFNLTHAQSHEHPAPLTPGEEVELDFPILATAHRFGPGHRVRLSLSASCWPLLWPSPEETTVEVIGAPSLSLPVRCIPGGERDEWEQPEFAAPPTPPKTQITVSAPPMRRELTADLLSGAARLAITTSMHQSDAATGLEYSTREVDAYSRGSDPLSPEAVCSRIVRYRRPALEGGPDAHRDDGWDVELRTESRMVGDATRFLVTNRLDAYEHGRRIHSRETSAEIPRDLN